MGNFKKSDINKAITFVQTDDTLDGLQYSFSWEWKKPNEIEWNVGGTRITSAHSVRFSQLLRYMGELVVFQEYLFRLRIQYNYRYTYSGSTETIAERTIAYSDTWSFAFLGGEQIALLKVGTGTDTVSIPLYEDIDNPGFAVDSIVANPEIITKFNAMIDENIKGQTGIVDPSSSFASCVKTSHGALAGVPRWDTRREYAHSYSFMVNQSYYYYYNVSGYGLSNPFSYYYTYYYPYSVPTYSYAADYSGSDSAVLSGYEYKNKNYYYYSIRANYLTDARMYTAYTYSYYTSDGLAGLARYYGKQIYYYNYADGTYYSQLQSDVYYYRYGVYYYTRGTTKYYYSYPSGEYQQYRRVNGLDGYYYYYYLYYYYANTFSQADTQYQYYTLE